MFSKSIITPLCMYYRSFSTPNEFTMIDNLKYDKQFVPEPLMIEIEERSVMADEHCSSYTKSDIEVHNDNHDFMEDEKTQLSLDPKLQTYLAQMSQNSGCWGKFFPIPFERAAEKSWWDPTFDSEILEEQFKKSSNRQNKKKFRYALSYMIMISTVWLSYFLIAGVLGDNQNWCLVCSLLFVLILCLAMSLWFTYSKIYNQYMNILTLSITILLTLLSLVSLVVVKTPPVGNIALCISMLFLLYTMIPLKLYVSFIIGILYSVCFELLIQLLEPKEKYDLFLLIRISSHFAIHVICFHICLMNNIRMRNTFMKVGQSLLVRRQLELEKRLKENMIHSLMPKSVADFLKKDDDNFTRRHSSDCETQYMHTEFRPFIMEHKENVSILFADIVGFTKMSSNKTAEELVDILNNLFQRFDSLCKIHNCEKISTLGDCYYCVSGCPESRPDHAECCVEMGLSMIQAIKDFDEEKNEEVNMRVGVHTGKVLCGIVGTRRFKFDVWSNDVTLANKMESTGKPGMIHVSEKTVNFLNDMYILEEAEMLMGLNTYFILGRKSDHKNSYSGSFRAEGRSKYANSLHLFVSPPSSNCSPSPQSRPRVLSCDTNTSYIKPQQHSQHLLSPDVCRIKASSLPSILDMEGESPVTGANEKGSACVEDIKTPTSSASSGKYAVRLKGWKIPKFMRKLSDHKPDIEVDVFTVSPLAEDGYHQVPTIIEASVNGKKKDSLSSVIKNEMEEQIKDNLDIKSYISQSRSDIGAYDYPTNTEFLRSSSYKSQPSRSPLGDISYLSRVGSNRSRRGRSPNFEGLELMQRERSATVSIGNLRPKNSLDVPSRLSSIIALEENPSRKDSGIRSNSRRSSASIPQMNNSFLNSHRVSGYYTSSQFSLNTSQIPKHPGPFHDKHGTCIQNLRKQSDRQLIKCVQDNSKSKSSYFMKPPLARVSLFFKDDDMERQYRMNVHYISSKDEQPIITLSNSNFNTYLDVLVSLLVFLSISFGEIFFKSITDIWLATFITLLILHFLGIALCMKSVVRWFDRIFWCFIRFYRWNLFGLVLVSLPLISAIVYFLHQKDMSPTELNIFTYLLFVGIIHFCNFTQVNCWIKDLFVTIVFVIIVISYINYPCEFKKIDKESVNSSFLNDSSLVMDNINITSHVRTKIQCFHKTELFLNMLILVILVWILTREFEIGYRLSFHANYVAIRDKNKVENLKNQADYLIYNIVPEHVAEQLKKEAKYSENFKNVAIIFASIVNFNEMYDESYEGGKECLRVLNELIGDFDELLDRPEFCSVEKIKTIGSTFMAASGLNSQTRNQQEDPYDHLYGLMEFAIEMQNVVKDFNRDLLGFDLELRIGYNFGDVTAAVIGNTKLYYDIWGDAVNIASRMDTTGENGRIQVGEHCLDILKSRYEFEKRGSIFVKGKDNMNVYFLKGKKYVSSNDVDQPT